MGSVEIPIEQLSLLMFIFLRITSVIFFLPFYDSSNIPALFKIGLSFSLSILFLPILKINSIFNISEIFPLIIGISSELIMGFGIGLCIKFIFSGIQLAGEISGYQMGLSIANVLDPSTGSQNSIISEIKYIAAILVFFSINGHHWFFKAMTDSFEILPPFGFHLNGSVMELILTFASNIFIISIKFSAPIIVSLLLTSISLGLLSRAVPQMNVFFVAMPIKIIVGVMFIGILFPLMVSYLITIYSEILNGLITFLKLGQ